MTTRDYEDLLQSIQGLLAGEKNVLSCLANFAAAVFHALPELSWSGFYLMDELGVLNVGPFQGKPACSRILPGKGVCGKAAMTKETVVVADVTKFPGHIACDAASRSEIVVPMVHPVTGALIGVWDVDSPVLARFTDADKSGMQQLVAALVGHCYGNTPFVLPAGVAQPHH